ncbi:MAG: hypothetical protein IPN10_11020 [Saprospiraceae bacterium]|nr:hypothetical protein [Saprospiraceae bacterium]
MKSILSLMMILISTGFVAGQNYWTKLNTDLVVSRGESVFQELPEKYSLYSLDHSLISLDLLSAPKLEENFVDQKFMEMVFPLANGKMEGFKVFEQPVMEEGLSQKYPF